MFGTVSNYLGVCGGFAFVKGFGLRLGTRNNKNKGRIKVT